MRRLAFAGTLVMLLAGCASYAWVKQDATTEMTARDEEACRAEARDLATTGYVYGRAVGLSAMAAGPVPGSLVAGRR